MVRPRILFVTFAVTMRARPKRQPPGAMVRIDTILFKFEFLAFDANLRRTCVNTGEKLPFIANDSFKPVCYVLGKAAQKPSGIMGRVMFFLLRMGFWLTVVCVLLPGSGAKTTSPDAQIDATQAVSLASAAVSDARGFCDRQPDACVVGSKVATAIGHKAEAGARTIYEFINAKLNEKSPATDSTAKVVAVSATGTIGQGAPKGTLTPADLQPAWHAPVPLPPRREARANRPAA
jgi:hypothetical protein